MSGAGPDLAPAPIAETSVAALIAGIAGTDPAPGAGAAGAIALALGIACARKAVRITAKHHPDRAALAPADDRLAALGEAARAGADADAARFAALVAALRLPHADPEQTHAREAAVAARAAALVTLAERLLAIGAAARRVVDAVAGAVQPSMAGDLIAARGLIAAADAIQQANLAENRALVR